MLGAYKKHPQAWQRMYVLYILCLRVHSANSIPFETTAILGRFDTSRIFKSGTDAVGSKQQRCFFALQKNSRANFDTEVNSERTRMSVVLDRRDVLT